MLHRPSRAIALRVGAVLVVLVTAGIVASDLAALHRRAGDFGPPRAALVARRDLPLGTTVDPGDVRARQVHESQLPPGVLDASSRAVGRVVRVPLLRGGFVADGNLAPRRRSGLNGVIPAGMRALRIVVSDAVRPRVGSPVDVLASLEPALSTSVVDVTSSDGLSEDAAASASVVARAVVVLAVDAARSTEGAPTHGVTLLVTPREARDLVFATTHGVVTLSLVPPEDAR